MNLDRTNLFSLSESIEMLNNLKDLSLSNSICCDKLLKYYKFDYSLNWKYNIVKKSLEHWSCPPLDQYNWECISILDWSNKGLTCIPFCIYIFKYLKALDVSNNKLAKIRPLLKSSLFLEKLYLHNNPNLNHLPNFLWNMENLKELKIDRKLIKDLPENTKIYFG